MDATTNQTEQDGEGSPTIPRKNDAKIGFTWSTESQRKAESIEVSNNGATASRPSTSGKNPAIMATEPLTKERAHFRVEISKLGTWIGIGVADNSFIVNGAAVLGSQVATPVAPTSSHSLSHSTSSIPTTSSSHRAPNLSSSSSSYSNLPTTSSSSSSPSMHCINSSYFCQTSSKIRIAGGKTKKATRISEGDVIDVAVEYDQGTKKLKIFYWLNETLQGCVDTIVTPNLQKTNSTRKSHFSKSSSTSSLEEFENVEQEISVDSLGLYPCVCLSTGSEVIFRNDDKPKLYLTIEKKEEDHWKWATHSDKKATTIMISRDYLVASRSSSESRNPSVFTLQPLTKKNPHFRVQVTKLGNWVGIGVADSNFVIQDNVVLGSQSGSINSSYFCQNTCKIRMYGEEMKDVSRVNINDIVDVAVDFENDNIFYWLNEKLQGHISCKNHHLTEGELYPIVNLSASTEVVLRNNDKPTLYMPIEKQKESKKALVLSAKSGNMQLMRRVVDHASPDVVHDAKNDMLFAALQGYKAKIREKVYHEVPLKTRLLIFLAHTFDKNSMFYMLPREMLYYIFEMGSMQFQHYDIIKYLVINESANVDEVVVNSCHHYPFTIACEIGNVELLKLLIAHGASIDDMRGQKAIVSATTGLRAAVDDREPERIKRFVQELFFLVTECQVKPDTDVLVGAALSGDISLVKFLVEDHHISPGYSGETFFSPLMAASKIGNRKVVEYLLDHGAADTILAKYEHKTARDFAKEENNLEISKLLKKYEDKKSKLGKVKQFFASFKSGKS